MKKKIAILVGIGVCAILLTSPALASAGYSKIYGNANEDDILDMRDVTYIKLVIFGKKPATTFADANYDGKISMLDVGQTKLIILGKEKKLTLIDNADRVVTVPRPIGRIVSITPDSTRAIIAFGGCDKLVGVDTYSKTCICYDSAENAPRCAAQVCGGRLFELPEVGEYFTYVNPELVVGLEPDVIFSYGGSAYIDAANTLQEKTGIPVVCAYPGSGTAYFDEMYSTFECIGTVVEKEGDAEELILFVEEKIDKVREVTLEIPEDEKPKVYLAGRSGGTMGGFTKTLTGYDPLDIAGGINVVEGYAAGMSMEVSKEQIIAWNPDIILLSHGSLKGEVPVTIESVLLDPDLQTLDAVKNKRVYYSLSLYCLGMPHARSLANVMYMAKLLHPEEFADLDVEEEGNEIYERFLGVSGLFSEYADYMVWLRERLDSQ